MNTQTPQIDIEDVVLQNLCLNKDYTEKVMPYLDKDLFSSLPKKHYFSIVDDFHTKYSSIPSKEAIEVEISQKTLDENQHADILKLHGTLFNNKYTKPEEKWLLAKTEEWCKDRKLFAAFFKSHSIYTGDDKTLTVDAIPDILSEALSFSFDSDLGHDYFDDALKRYDFFHNKVSKLPFVIESLNGITNGGVERKTLSAFIAQTNAGKSIMMCNLAAGYIRSGYNVLLITMEMAEEKLGERIDANLLNIPMDLLWTITKDDFKNKMEKAKLGVSGKLIIKEYPTSSAHSGHFKVLIKELEKKEKFKPDVIIVDYLNICASAKIKSRNDMYTYNKSIAEELRAIAQETNTAMWTCLQFNRSGMNSTDADITNTSESMGIAHSLDMLLGLIVTDELVQQGQVMVKQLKSRFGDRNKNETFMIGLDKTKMRFYDLTNSSPQSNFSKPTSTQTSINNKLTAQHKPTGIKGIKV